MTCGGRRLHKVEILHLHASPNTIRVIKSGAMYLEGRIARMRHDNFTGNHNLMIANNSLENVAISNIWERQ
jgi:hypothetical protein